LISKPFPRPASSVFYSYSGTETVNIYSSSYAGMTGTWMILPNPPGIPPWNNANHDPAVATMQGMIHHHSAIKMSDVVDGTSNTMLYGERSKGILPQNIQDNWHWWHTGLRTQVCAMWPLNPQKRVRAMNTMGLQGMNVFGNPTIIQWIWAASSNHPGGANFAFVDGSVRFLKESIESWPMNNATGDPVGLTYSPTTYRYTMAPNIRFGVYQALSTRNGGEVISSDSY
jgi:prepilin-type processing-associated H-X9-DG protein